MGNVMVRLFLFSLLFSFSLALRRLKRRRARGWRRLWGRTCIFRRGRLLVTFWERGRGKRGRWEWRGESDKWRKREWVEEEVNERC